MDKKKSLLNVSVAIFFKVILLVLMLLSRRALIQNVGNEANGINSLYSSIIGFLSITELGIGTAITYCMYKPIVNNQKDKVAALYKLFVKLYRSITLVILIVGISIMPFLPTLAKGYTIGCNLYLTFGITLLSVLLGYASSAKSSLVNAYKNNYITTAIYSTSLIIEQVLQIIVLVIFKSFELYLACKIVGAIFMYIATEIYARKKHKEILSIDAHLDEDSKHEVIKNTKAMFMHKIGMLLVNTIDSIIISAFIGVTLLGKYSNYTTIVTAMTGVITLFFSPLSSVLGHLCAKGNIEEEKKYYNLLYTFNFIIGVIFFLGYYAIIDELVMICFGQGRELLLEKQISFVITLNYFIQFMRQLTLLFRDATGTFYNDRYKPLIEGIFNLILSILFVNFMGVVGVIVATIITNLIICHVVEPYVLHKNEFKTSVKPYYIKNYLCILIFAVLLFCLNYLLNSNDNIWMNLLINGFISVGISLFTCMCIFIFNKEFRYNILKLSRRVFRKSK